MTEIPLFTWSIAKIAERDGVSRQAVSKTVRKLVELQPDTPIEVDGRGRITGVSLAHYDEHRERFVNPAKASAVIRPADKPSASLAAADSFEEARRQSEWIRVRREHLRFQEEVGKLARTDKFREATQICGGEVKAVVMRLPSFADELAEAVAKEGVSGARRVLRKASFEIGNAIADKLEELAASAPLTDPLIEAAHPTETKGTTHD